MNRLGNRRCWARRPQPQRPMRPRGVVVSGVHGKHLAQVPLTEIIIRSVTSVRTVNTKRSAKQFARGHRGGILTTSMPASAMTASNEAVNCPARSRTRNRNRGDAIVEVHHEVAGLLGGPRSVGMRGHAQDVQVAVAALEHE